MARRALSLVKSFLVAIYLKSGTFTRSVLRRVFSSNQLAGLYYKFVSSAFRGEHSRVLAGITQFMTNDQSRENVYALRRNIHRIEKGLVMRPRRDRFAADYIGHMVECYQRVSFIKEIDPSLLGWAHDVLDLYFSVSKGEARIEAAREIFQKCPPVGERPLKAVPRPRASLPHITISYQDMLLLAQRRRSVRWYVSRKVDRELIDKAILVASYAPSACNRQPFEFRIFDDPDLVRKVMNVPGGTSGWSESPPVVVVVVGHLNAFEEERDRHLIYIDASLAVMSFMFALETLGLSSCVINFPDIPEKNKAISQLLSLYPDEVVTMMMALGYAEDEGLVPFSAKKSLDTLRSYNCVSRLGRHAH